MELKDLDRFLNYVHVPLDENGEAKDDECWEWIGTKVRGYGNFKLKSKTRSAHHVIWEHCYGEIPSLHEVHHKCRNPACVNIEHLECLTKAGHFKAHQKTHCIRGHEFTPENTMERRSPNKRTFWRVCRRCEEFRRSGKVDLGTLVSELTEEQIITLMKLKEN